MTAPTDEALADETRPLVFISHRHEDKALADVIGRFMRSGSAGQVDVYQSSDANSEGPKAGGVLTDELQRALWRAGRVILVYTRTDADWGWCLFECGLALQPNTPPTCLTVFSCGSTAPPQLAGRVHVKIRDRGDIQRFTNHFLTDKGFFPGLNKAIAGFQENDPNVLAAAETLFDDLAKIPDPRDENVQDWPAYPFIQLEIDAEGRARLPADGPYEGRLLSARELILEARISDSDSEGARIFGRRWDPAVETRFGELVRGWCERFGADEPPWLDALSEQVMEAAGWCWPTLHWVLMRSMDQRDSSVYGPVVTRVRRWPDDRMQFDIVFEPFELTDGGERVKVRLPAAEPRDGAPVA
jgi:TIR domain-containing protein